MKRFLYAAALLLVLSAMFVSCNKDNGGSSSSIVGTWGMVKEECYNKDGIYDVINYDVNKDKIVFSETTMTIYRNNSPEYTFAYEYDSSTKNLYAWTGYWYVQKLTSKELVLKSMEDTVKWSVIYLEKK